MAARIYSLAKELKIDSKELVDICTKAGITGKGSALASLADDEVVRLKEYLGNRAAKQTQRDVAAVSVGAPVRALPAKAPSKPPVLTGGGGTAVALAPPPPPSPPAPTQPERPLGISRDQYIPPAGAGSGRPPVIEARDKPPVSKKRTLEPRPVNKPSPTVRLASLPPSSAKQPAAPPKSAEPAPQKPDIKLPADVMRASKAGAKPLADHIKKADERRRAEEATKPAAKPGGRGARGGATEGAAPLSKESRGRGGRGRGGMAPVPEDAPPAGKLGGRDARQAERRRQAASVGKRLGSGDDEETGRLLRSRKRSLTRQKGPRGAAAPRKTSAVIQLPITVREYSEELGIPASQVLAKLMGLGLGLMPNISMSLDADTVELISAEFGVDVEVRRPLTAEERLQEIFDETPDDESQLEPRPPVITFLGHVDHGKTSLLDKIIGIDVVSGESGGITQHIRAYEIERNGRKISFVDTPGHEAFTEMRARGANVTDIAVLVVAADDGVMPQTEEAISHARAAGVPIVVALNKIDLPGVNVERIFGQLAENQLVPSQWGGDVEVVKTSAHTGEGMDTLLETLLTIAELHDLKANPNRHASGTCLEAELHEGRGVVAKFIVQRGTLKVGDSIVCGAASGNVKALYDTLNPRKKLEAAGPSTPVNVTGLDVAPAAGDKFYVLEDIAQARDLAVQRHQQARVATLGGGQDSHVTLENLFDRLGDKRTQQTLNIILRADVRGSIEAILKEFGKLEHPEVKIKVLQSTVGGISEADVHLADASDAVIIGFNVVPDEKARLLAERQGVQIRRYDIIYQVTDDLRKALEGMLKPEKRDAELGRALVLRTFVISRVGTVAGCRVLSGTVQRNGRLRVIRENRIVGDYPIDTLRREKDDAREVREGLECGIKLAGFNDLKEGDVLECYRVEEVARTL